MNGAAKELSDALCGVTSALITPMTPDLEIDSNGIAEHVEFQQAHGVRVVVPGGTIGEFPLLTPNERSRLLEVTIASAHPTGLVLASVSADRLPEVAGLASHATSACADGLLIMMPPYYQLDADEQYSFLTWFDREVNCPFVLYATRDCASAPPSLSLLERCIELNWFAALKDATGDLDRLRSLSAHFGPALRIVNASEPLLLEGARAGLKTAMTATACFAPTKVRDVLAGLEVPGSAAGAAFSDILSYRSLFDPGPTKGARPCFLPWAKAACEAIGLPGGPPRPPLRGLAEQERSALMAVISQHFGNRSELT